MIYHSLAGGGGLTSGSLKFLILVDGRLRRAVGWSCVRVGAAHSNGRDFCVGWAASKERAALTASQAAGTVCTVRHAATFGALSARHPQYVQHLGVTVHVHTAMSIQSRS